MIQAEQILEQIDEGVETLPPSKKGKIATFRVMKFTLPVNEYNKKERVWYRRAKKFIEV
jgi:hypothetical protein